MKQKNLLDSRTYDPGRLLDALLEKLNLKNEVALAQLLGVAPAVLSNIRHRRVAVDTAVLISMHEASGFSIRQLQQLMRLKRISRRVYVTQEAQREKLALLAQKAAEHGGQCLSDTYVNKHTHMQFLCRIHGVFKARPNNILNSDQWCRYCSHERMKDEMSERLLHYVAERGGALKSPYLNARTHVVVSCPIHGDWRVLPDNLLSKRSWCPHCARSQSRPGSTEENALRRKRKYGNVPILL